MKPRYLRVHHSLESRSAANRSLITDVLPFSRPALSVSHAGGVIENSSLDIDLDSHVRNRAQFPVELEHREGVRERKAPEGQSVLSKNLAHIVPVDVNDVEERCGFGFGGGASSCNRRKYLQVG
eukprot:CAMPEP_0118984490 /NCGR_PEP_ID=MMETSP1173-20130426/37892_1 /TAXON_ID=1034831 /ORGANISM="Rhizochromulina marina cf, Strain CCMP1243" /LENGTH=123 /DNA_ID=CAMNT_0006935155 /DNA_START=5 /DNA_END=372 /DNA_ORIENTATION=+